MYYRPFEIGSLLSPKLAVQHLNLKKEKLVLLKNSLEAKQINYFVLIREKNGTD